MKKVKITLDPGHGGKDSGAVGCYDDLFESRAALDIALRARDLLQPHVVVQMTRDTDVFVTLRERCLVSNEWGADLFCSIHLNSADTSASGFEVFTSGSTKSKALAKEVWSSFTSAFKEQRDRGIKRAGFHVLKYSDAPAILVECCFLSNEEENKWVSLSETRQAMAEAIAAGILQHIGIKSVSSPLTMDERVSRIESHLGL